MRFFLFFLFLLFDNLQGSTLPHKRCTRGLNTTLQTNFNGVYQRISPCTNAEIETTSYVASHEFCHQTKENNWTDDSHTCSSIISNFLRAIGNLVQFNNKQKGTFNFHINTSISQKQDLCDLNKQKYCDSMPIVVIEATDCEISPKSSCGSLSDETENKDKIVSFCGTFTNDPNQLASTTEAADQNQKYEKIITEQPEEALYLDDYPTTIIPSQETTAQHQPQTPMQAEGRWQQDENSWTETQPTITEYSPAIFTDISQLNIDEPTLKTSNPNNSKIDSSTTYASLTPDTNSSPNPLIYYSTPGTDFEEKSRQQQSILNSKQSLTDNRGGKVPYNQRSDLVYPPTQTLTTELPFRSDRTQLQRPNTITPSREEYQPAEFEATSKTPLGFNYRPEVPTSFLPATVESENDELSVQNSATKPPEDDFYTEVGKPSEGLYFMDYDAPTTLNPPLENNPNYSGRFSTSDQTPNDQTTTENLSPVTLSNPELDSNERSTMSHNSQIFQPINAPKIQPSQSLVKSNFPESFETQLMPPSQSFTNERIPEYSAQNPDAEENQMTDIDFEKSRTQNTFTQPQQPPMNETPSRQFSLTFPLEQQPIEDFSASPPRPPSSQTHEEETTTTDNRAIEELERKPLRDFAVGETEERPDYLQQQSSNFLQPDSQIRGNAIASGFHPTFSPQGPRENVEILRQRSPSAENGVFPIQFSTTPIPEYVVDRENKISGPAFMNPQNVNALKQSQPQLMGNIPPGELPQPSAVEQQGNFEVPKSRYTTTETYEDEFQTDAGPIYRPSLQLGINANIAQTPEQQETSSQPEPQFITESSGKSNKNSEYSVISTETTPSQFQTTPIPEYTDYGQAFDVTTVSPQTLNTFDQSKSQLRGNTAFDQFPQTYSPEIEGIKISQSETTEVKTNNKKFQAATKNPIQLLNYDNQFEDERKTQTPNSALLNQESSNSFVRPELQPETSTSERPMGYFEIPQPGTTSKIPEENAVTTDFQTTQEFEHQQLPLRYNRQQDDDKTRDLVSPFLNSQTSGYDVPLAPDYGNSRQLYPNFTPEQNLRKNFELQPLERQREEPNNDFGQQPIEDFKLTSTQTFEENTVTTDYQTTAEPEHQTSEKSTLNDMETENESNSDYRQQHNSNTFGLPESQFRGNPIFQQTPLKFYEPDNITLLTRKSTLSSKADASNFITGNHYATSFDNRPTENRSEFQTFEMNSNYRQDNKTPTPSYGLKPTPNENKPPQEVKDNVGTAEERPSTAFKKESFADSTPTSAGPENGLSGALPSPAFVPRYPGQVLNENATTPISNAPALYSEQTAPKISSLRWQSPAESHTFDSPAYPTEYNYRDPALYGPSGMPGRPFDTSRAPYFPNGRPQFDRMSSGRNNDTALPGRPNLPYYPAFPRISGTPSNYRLPSQNPDIRQPMDGSYTRNVRPFFNDRSPIPPGRNNERPGYSGLSFFQTSDSNRRYLNNFSPENQIRREDDNYQGERLLINPEIASPTSLLRNPPFEQQYEPTQSERFSNNTSQPRFPPNFHSNERFSTDEELDFHKPLSPDKFRHDTMLPHRPPSLELNSNQAFGPIRHFPAIPEPANFRPGGYDQKLGPSRDMQYYPDQEMNNYPETRFYPVNSPREISTFPEKQNQQVNPNAPLQRPPVNKQQDSQSFSTASSTPESQAKSFPPTDLSNSTENAQDSFPLRHQYPTEVSSTLDISESPETQTVSYIPTGAPSELESQFLGNDQSISNEFQPRYSSESQTKTTLPYSNDRPIALTEQRVSDVATRNGDLMTNDIPLNMTDQVSPIQQEFGAPFSSEANNNFIHLPSTVSPKFTTAIYDETISTTDFPAPPSESSPQSPSVNNSRDLVGNKQKLSTEEYNALTFKANVPLNLESTPVAFAEVTPVPIQPNFQYQQAQDNTPTSTPSNADKPQPQPSFDYITDISGYETTENNAQTFSNSSPQQFALGLNRLPFSQNAFPREFQENQDYGEMVYPTRNHEIGFGAPIMSRLDEQSSLQIPVTAAVTPYDPEPILDTAKPIGDASPQTLSTAEVKNDKETETADLSSAAPRLQPQMALEHSYPISEKNSVNTWPDRQHLVTSPSPDFTSTLPMNYEKISDKSTLSSSAESQIMNGQPFPQKATPPTHQTQTVEYYNEEIMNDSPITTTPTPNFSDQYLNHPFNAPQESQYVAADRNFQHETAPGSFNPAETQVPIYDRQITNTQPMNREGDLFKSYKGQVQQPPQTPEKQLQTYAEDKTTAPIIQVNQFTMLTNSETNERIPSSTPSTYSRNFTPLVTPIPSFAPEEHPSSDTTEVMEETLTTDLPMTDSTVDSQSAYPSKLLINENKELEVLQKNKATKTEKFESPAESLDQPGADFLPEANYLDSQQAMTHRPMIFTTDSELPEHPSPVNDEQHSNPLLHTLQSHLAFPLHGHLQATAYSQTDSGDPYNSFEPTPPYPRIQNFGRNSVPSQGPPQPDSVVSGLSTPSNTPDLTGRFDHMSRPLMNPWERFNGRGVSAPERF